MHPSLAALAAYRQFVIFKIVPSPSRPGKMDKLPCNLAGEVVSAHDPANWMDEQTAETLAIAYGAGWGVGFVFTEGDPFWFLDIDGCRLGDGTPENPYTWSPLALQLCAALQGCAVEVSQSGTGIHIFGMGRPPAHGCTNKLLGLEFYHAGRFVALTGINAQGNAAVDASAVLPWLVEHYFPMSAPGAIEQAWSDGPCDGWNGPKDDDELIRRAMQSRSTAAAFGDAASFADLWNANVPVLSKAYPDPNGRPYDESAADAALASHLAYWTGKDCERINRLMLRSALVRDKWERDDYLPRTIRKEVGRKVDFRQDPIVTPVALEAPVTDAAIVAREGNGFLDIAVQQQKFAGCVYVNDEKKIFVPNECMMDHEQFKSMYGGFNYNMDARNGKVTRDAWEALLHNEAYKIPRVSGTCFRPDREPGSIVNKDGATYLNIYAPIPIRRVPGDVSLFLNHLAKLLPDKRDAQILLCYMAACVQYQGTKFQWAPLLQGVQGNGKTFFSRCLAYSIGEKYTHWPVASKLTKDFNKWLYGKIFFAVEDIHVTHDRAEVIEKLKPMITGKQIEIEAKGVDQVAREICGNFLFNSNHKDAVKATENERRFCILFSAQQDLDDMRRDGMLNTNYFDILYSWFDKDGAANIAEFLFTYQIPAEFNPAADCQRAPETTSTRAAISASLGIVEQEIIEAVAEERQGFRGDWISSYYLDELLLDKRLTGKVAKNKYVEMLESLGYVHHPWMKGGRPTRNVIPDGRKARLFVKRGSPASERATVEAAMRDYEEANKATLAVPFPRPV